MSFSEILNLLGGFRVPGSRVMFEKEIGFYDTRSTHTKHSCRKDSVLDGILSQTKRFFFHQFHLEPSRATSPQTKVRRGVIIPVRSERL